MRLEGRIALGLDEFMLRFGHLKVLLLVLRKTYGNRSRIARRLAETLTELVEVSPDQVQDLGEYLTQKKLCVVRHSDGSETAAHPRARYAHLRVTLGGDGKVLDISALPAEGPLRVWLQDLLIADSRTRSKVGAVTADTREMTNKSGVSHLVDWAVILGIANKRLSLTSAGRALSTVCDQAELRNATALRSNPYVIGDERLAFAWVLFMTDGDVLVRLINKLATLPALAKAEAMQVIIDVSNQMRDEVARGGPSVTLSASRTVRDFQKDLGLNAHGSSRPTKPSSTVWHRMSSRLEALTDIGLLEKTDRDGSSRQFDYYYRPTEALKRASRTLEEASTPSEWVAKHLAEALATNPAVSQSSNDYRPELVEAVKLCLGPTGVHIDSYAVVAASLAAMRGKLLSLGEARERLTNLAVRHPDIARLSRGYSGSRAEFASVVVGKIEQTGVSAFD